MADQQQQQQNQVDVIVNNPRQYTRAEAVSLIEVLNVTNLISDMEIGRIIIEGYKNANPHQFARKIADRKYVTKIVGDAGLRINPQLGVTDIETMSKKICEAFDNEKPESYFQVEASGKYSGLLWNYVKNKKHEICKIRKSIEARENEEVPPDENEIANKNFLDENTCVPWERVKTAWQITSRLRKIDLNTPAKKKKKRGPNDTLPVEDFFTKWPSLKHPSGYQLVQLDFDNEYPDAGKLSVEKLDQLIHKLQVLKASNDHGTQHKWEGDINNLKKSIVSNRTNDDVKTACKIKLLAFLMPPHGRANRTIKTTVVDVYNSMIMHVQTAEAVDEAIAKRSRKLKSLNKDLQPILVVIGADFDNLDEFICCINNVRWKCDNFITGIDVVFKSYFTLDMNYPYESEVQWGVIQHYIYKLNSQVNSEANRLLINLSSIDDNEGVDYAPRPDEVINNNDAVHEDPIIEHPEVQNADKN